MPGKSRKDKQQGNRRPKVDTRAQGHRQRFKGKAQRRVPRAPPPKAGEPEIKVIDGKKQYWCAKCNRWTESHGTDGHKTKEQLQAERSQPSKGQHGAC